MMMKWRADNISVRLLIILLVSSISIEDNGNGFVFAEDALALGEGMRFELIHRDSLPELNGNGNGMRKPQQQVIKERHQRDLVRREMVSHRMLSQRPRKGRRGRGRGRRTRPCMEMPMNSAYDWGMAEYLVEVKVGTPPQKFRLIADTGSDLTWMHCSCGSKCGKHSDRQRINNTKVFLADRSSTFRTVPCSSNLCRREFKHKLAAMEACPSPFTPCSYNYSYVQGSAALGHFAHEAVSVTLTNGTKTRLDNVVVGCTKVYNNAGKSAISEGILGLGFGDYSFTRKAADTFGGKFSYCLVDHFSHANVSNYLKIGPTKEASLLKRMKYTDLFLSGPFYGITIKGISVGSTLLKIPRSVWDPNAEGGVILDSGTSLTHLAQPAYQPVRAALTEALSQYPRITHDVEPLDYCFNATTFDESSVPQLTLHMAGGTRFQPPVKSYIIDLASQIKCIGLVPLQGTGPSIIGNIMQQNHLWEFDFALEKLGFALSTCF